MKEEIIYTEDVLKRMKEEGVAPKFLLQGKPVEGARIVNFVEGYRGVIEGCNTIYWPNYIGDNTFDFEPKKPKVYY